MLKPSSASSWPWKAVSYTHLDVYKRQTLGEVDLATLTGEQVRTRVGYVSDDPHVFATTLAQNVRLARPGASDDEVLGALRSAGLGPLLSTLPDALATRLGGATTGLSGGERRRLGVARALLAQRPVMVLDEPTEGLDCLLYTSRCV